jgi:aldose 1-epimerase
MRGPEAEAQSILIAIRLVKEKLRTKFDLLQQAMDALTPTVSPCGQAGISQHHITGGVQQGDFAFSPLRKNASMNNAQWIMACSFLCLGLLGLAGCSDSAPPAQSAAPADATSSDDAVPDATAPDAAMPVAAAPAAEAPAAAPPSATGDDLSATTAPKSETAAMKVTSRRFGETSGGQETLLFTCSNGKGLAVTMTNYGATLVTVETPDRKGVRANINLGFDSVADYEKHTAYFGCAVGRFANRIANGKFTLDDKQYTLATNNGPHHLHGGVEGFNRKVWQAEPVEQANQAGVRFRYRSPDGEEGYPGTLDVTVTYLITDDDRLIMDYTAETDQPTILNLTNHAYWNLAGAGSGPILDHVLTLAADRFIEVDETLIPTGEMPDVAGTPMDFLKPHPIGQRIKELTNDPRGYDLCYVLHDREERPTLAARVREPKSGRVMEVHTTQPGVQLYTSNFLNGDKINGGHEQHAAFCLETQHFPDAPNRPEYPSTVLRPGEKFHQVTIHRFTTD